MKIGFRELIFFLVLLAVPIASYFYVFEPRNNEIEAARKEIETKQARLAQLAEVASHIEDIGLAIEEGKKSIELIEAKLPSQQDVEGILEQVWQIARRNSLVVKSFKSDKSVPAAMYMEQPLKVEMQGQFEGFYQFLLELENLPRITRIHELELDRVGSKSGPEAAGQPPGSMTAKFTLSIYFEPQEHDAT